MKRLYLCATIALLSTASAQPPSTVPEQLKAMQACSFLTGRWSGEGWIAFSPGQRSTFHETEVIEPKLGGLLLLIQGQGQDATGRTVHAALAVLSFDGEDKQYHFRAYEQMGRSVEGPAECKNNTMTWSLAAGPATIRYSISLNAKGQWHETGTATVNGAPEQQMFEMTLNKASG
jgi:hypothetical protein